MVRANKLECSSLVAFQPSHMIVGKDRGPYYKTLRTHNVHKIAKFHGKLVFLLLSVTSAGFDKHTSLFLESVHYKSLMFYSTGPRSYQCLHSCKLQPYTE
jgi:hypothetical protein